MEFNYDDPEEVILHRRMVSVNDYCAVIHQLTERMYQIRKNYDNLTEREDGFISEILDTLSDSPMDLYI